VGQLLTLSNADIRPISSRSVVAQVTEPLGHREGPLASGKEAVCFVTAARAQAYSSLWH
jgi:hypothetical protein